MHRIPVADAANQKNIFTERPEIEDRQLISTVHIPDKGTVALRPGEFTLPQWLREGVKPGAKPQPDKRGPPRQILLLIKPTIIIPSEAKKRLWPGLLDNPTEYDVGKRISH